MQRFSGSRRNPQFGADALAESLESHGMDTFTPDAVVRGDCVHYPARPSLDL